jgi:molybdopterin synthase catalytic subunit
MKIWADIQSHPIQITEAFQFIKDDSCGGTSFFMGTVRNHDLGKKVKSLEYEAYTEMCVKKINEFAQESFQKFKIQKLYCVHRIGQLNIGDISILIACSAHHRDAAFKATRFMIEKIKLDLPVWKKEHYEDYPSEWLKACSHTHFNWKELEL